SDGQEAVGRFDQSCMLGALEADAGGAPGLAYAASLLSNVSEELNRHRSQLAPVLEPGLVQLACYDGNGARYTVHRDHSDFGLLPFLGDGLPTDPAQRIVARRRVTAILYLQENWDAEWGGAFRAHDASVFEVLEKQAHGEQVAGAECPTRRACVS
ncbi:unnamed protein product, partial [Polarella glacialis]